MTDEQPTPDVEERTAEPGDTLPEVPESSYAADAQPLDPPATEWPEDVVSAVRAAEAAAQASVCDLPDGDRPDELVQALDRRVEVNLAQYDGGDIRRVGSTDQEVRELEAPWSRRVPAPAPENGDSHRRRSTKKKSTKRGQS